MTLASRPRLSSLYNSTCDGIAVTAGMSAHASPVAIEADEAGSDRRPHARAAMRRAPSLRFAPLWLAPVVLLVHGYHPYAGDAALYTAGVRHLLDPSFYAVNAIFVAAFTRFSLFAWLVAGVVRLTHLPLSWVLLGAYLGSVVLFLAAVRALAARLFAGEPARWCCLLLAAGAFTLPVAGTALFLMDPYVTARSFSTPLGLLAVAACLDRAWGRTTLLLLLAALLHPLMAAYSVALVLLLGLVSAGRGRWAAGLCGAGCLAAAGIFVAAHAGLSGTQTAPTYLEAVSLAPRRFLFLARWRWYEDLGLALPLLLFALAWRRWGSTTRIGALCLACLLLGTTGAIVSAAFVPPGGPYPLVPLQVLRCFHPIYAVGLVLCGGVLASLSQRSRFAAVSLVVLLFGGMFAAQRVAWQGNSMVEWPGAASSNPWQQAFLWIRSNTPRDAVFAFDPYLVYLPEEDEQGFRSITERDHLADDKDGGVAVVFPSLADRWARQRNATLRIDGRSDPERRTTLLPLGATWLLLPPGASTHLPCPYENRVVRVCRLAP